jgi:hypothetical protein
MEDAEKVQNELYIDMYSIRLIIDRLQRHPYPGTKDSVVVPTTKASQTTTTRYRSIANCRSKLDNRLEIEPIRREDRSIQIFK